jgi:hypothetical protein
VSEKILGWFIKNHYLDQKVWEREAKMAVFFFWEMGCNIEN